MFTYLIAIAAILLLALSLKHVFAGFEEKRRLRSALELSEKWRTLSS